MSEFIGWVGARAGGIMEDYQQLTLVFPIKDGTILLGYKKKGLGAHKYNGFGGKVEDGETIEQAALRELWEECYLVGDANSLERVATLYFTFEESDLKLQVHVFFLTGWSNTPASSNEMIPQWYCTNGLPYDEMWEDDPSWLPLCLKGRKVFGKFHFNSKEELLRSEVTVLNV